MRDRYRVVLTAGLVVLGIGLLRAAVASSDREAGAASAISRIGEVHGVAGAATGSEETNTHAAADAARIAALAEAVPSESQLVLLDALSRGAAGLVLVSGYDPAAPRPLRLWRSDRSPAEPLALGESNPDGSLYFPPIVAPRDGAELVVTDATRHPSAADALNAQRLEGRGLVSPRATIRELRLVEGDEVEFVLRILPAEASGEVLLADASEQVFARYSLATRPSAGDRVFDVGVVLAAGESELLMAQELPDGRRSQWRALTLRAAP